MKITNSKGLLGKDFTLGGNNAVITSYTVQKAPLDLNNQLNMSKEAGYEGKPKLFFFKKKKSPRDNFRNCESPD